MKDNLKKLAVLNSEEWRLAKAESWLRSVESDAELPMNIEFYHKLHDKIMTQVKETEIEKPRKWIPTNLKSWFLVTNRNS